MKFVKFTGYTQPGLSKRKKAVLWGVEFAKGKAIEIADMALAAKAEALGHFEVTEAQQAVANDDN